MSRVGATTLGTINQGAEADPCNEDYEQNVLPQQVNTHVLNQYWAEKGNRVFGRIFTTTQYLHLLTYLRKGMVFFAEK